MSISRDGATTGVVMGMNLANAKRQSWPATGCICPSTRKKRHLNEYNVDKRSRMDVLDGDNWWCVAGTCTRNSQ